MQDKDGYMWFGGRDGLLRYDGYQFITLELELDDPNGTRKRVSNVMDILQDSRGDIWVASRGGLLRLDQDLLVLKKLSPEDGQNHTVYHDTVNRLGEAPDGRIIVGAYGGLILIDSMTHNLSYRWGKKIEGNTPLENIVNDIYVDGDIIWLATEGGLIKYHWSSAEVDIYLPKPKEPQSKNANAIRTLAFDKNNKLWFGGESGTYQLDTDTNKIKNYTFVEGDYTSISGKIIRDIFLDSYGFLWLGTEDGGLSLYRYESDDFVQFLHLADVENSLSHNSVRRIFEDANGDLWVGTYPMGLNYFDRTSLALITLEQQAHDPNSLLNNTVHSMQEDGQGNIWLGTDAGLSYWQRQQNTFRHYFNPIADNQNKEYTSILSLLIDHEGTVWAGSWGKGVSYFDSQKQAFVPLPFGNKTPEKGNTLSKQLVGNSVWSIYEDSSERLWFGTHEGGLNLYDRENKQFKHYTYDANKHDSLSNQLVWSIFEDSYGLFWVGTAWGLNLMDREKGNFTRFYSDDDDLTSLSNSGVSHIFEDSKKRLWFGTDDGLNLYNREQNNFRRFSTDDGLSNNGIKAIREDIKGNLWVSTNNGISEINGESLTIDGHTQFAGEHLGGFSNGSALTSKQGELIFGRKRGLRLFNIDSMAGNEFVPPVVLTDFKMFTGLVTVGAQDGLLSKTLDRTSQLVLAHDQNMFSISFSALNFRSPEQNQYAYKLEGFDKEWRYVGTQRNAVYTNLDAGSYVFNVKASNNDGVWNEQAKKIKIIQLPPPWLTWWAKLIYFLCAFASIYSYVRNQRQKREDIRQLNILLEEKVGLRTTELKHSNTELTRALDDLKASQKKMVEQETMASLGQLVAGVAHEVNTPIGISVTANSHLQELNDRLGNLFTQKKLKSKDLERYLEQANESIDIVGKSLNKADELISSFKQVAVDQSSDAIRTINLQQYIQEILTTLRPEIKRVKHEIHVDCVNEKVKCNAGAIYQIITNLIINAIRHGFDDGVQGNMYLNIYLQDNMIHLYFNDDGKGLNQAHLTRLFEPFFTTKRSSGGSGLGTHIIYNLVTQSLNGQIEVESEQGHGLHYKIRFPSVD